jgi:hypothetical protein
VTDFARPPCTVTCQLDPDNSPTTELRATSRSPRCADTLHRKCARNGEATVASPCAADFGVDFRYCMEDCLWAADWGGAGCEAPDAAYMNCVAPTSPGAQNWRCAPSWGDWIPRPLACADLSWVDYLDCAYPL